MRLNNLINEYNKIKKRTTCNFKWIKTGEATKAIKTFWLKLGEIIDLAVEEEIINKAGSWFSYNGEKIGQGRENVKKYLTENERKRMGRS